MPDLTLGHYQALLAVCVFLAGVHAYQKLSPYFAVTWFGSGLLFGSLWAGRAEPESVLLPVLVVYMAAATTKGLVETRPRFAGNHVVHVLMTGLFTGLLALPFEASAARSGWSVPRPAPRSLLGEDPAWLGGASLDAALQWALVGLLFYGTYKLLDHIGLGKPAQTVLLFAAMPLLVTAIESLHGLV